MNARATRCASTGVVLMTLRNAHHIGRVGAYGEIAMAAGLISVHFVNVTDHLPTVAPWRLGQSRVSLPTPSVLPYRERRTRRRRCLTWRLVRSPSERLAWRCLGENGLVRKLLIDNQGRATTDPSVMYKEPRGSLLPFGDHKGSGLMLMCELLAGGLSGGGTDPAG